MSQAVRTSEVAANAGSVAEIVIRAAAGVMGTQALARIVRTSPLMAILLASGVGYLLGRQWFSGQPPVRGKGK